MADVTLTAASGNWTVPTGVVEITVECFGGGGAGGAGISSSGGGGGGGAGAYSKKTAIAVTPEQVIPYVCGAGGIKNNTGTGGAGQDTTFNTNVCVGDGGLGGLAYSAMTGGAGGTEANSVGDASSQAKGGNGGTGNITYGGGGGESGNFASPNYVDGNAGTDGSGGGAGGTGTTGYDGGAGAAAHGQGSDAPSYSGGGGGAGHQSGGAEYGGTGGPGIILITYTEVAPTTTIDTPDNNATGLSVTPDLLFTGTDANADEVEYEVQVDTNSNFNSLNTDLETTDDTFYGTSYYKGPNETDTVIRTGGWGDWYYSYLKFDVSSGPSSGVGSVILYLYESEISVIDPVCHIRRVTSDWVGSTLTSTNHPTESSTNYGNFPALTGAGGWISVDITQLYKDWKNGTYSNYGLKIQPTVNNNSSTAFDSSDNVSGYAPYIRINGLLVDILSSTESPSHFAGTGSPSPFPSGNQITYSVQAAAGLVASTDYYWRVRAKDALGSNTWSAWSPGDASQGYNKFTTTGGSTATVEVSFTTKRAPAAYSPNASY